MEVAGCDHGAIFTGRFLQHTSTGCSLSFSQMGVTVVFTHAGIHPYIYQCAQLCILEALGVLYLWCTFAGVDPWCSWLEYTHIYHKFVKYHTADRPALHSGHAH